MSFGINTKVEVISTVYLGRWVQPFERGFVEGRHVSPAGQEVYDVMLGDGKVYTFAPSEIVGVYAGEASSNNEKD